MKVSITHLKAPWPEGAVVGSVVDLQAEQLPGCFIGKCVEAPADAEPSFTWAPVVHPEPEAAEPAKLPASQEDLQAARALQKAAEDEAAELRGLVQKLQADLSAANEALAAATAKKK